MSEHTDSERDAELIAQLDQESLRLLFPERFAGPFEVTVLHPPLTGEAAEMAARLAGDSLTEADAHAADGSPRMQARFELDAIERLHEYYGLLEANFAVEAVEILIGGRPVPMVRELWLPLLWLLRS